MLEIIDIIIYLKKRDIIFHYEILIILFWLLQVNKAIVELLNCCTNKKSNMITVIFYNHHYTALKHYTEV